MAFLGDHLKKHSQIVLYSKSSEFLDNYNSVANNWKSIIVIISHSGLNEVSNINPVHEDQAYRVLGLVLNQQSATISLHFTRLAIAPGQRYFSQWFRVINT